MREESPRDTVEKMHDHFMQIYAMSGERGSEAHARTLLEQDIELLGYYFGLADPLDPKAGFSLLAECIAYLRIKDSPVPMHKMIDRYIETIFSEFRARSSSNYPIQAGDSPKELVGALKTLALARDLLSSGRIMQEQEVTLREGFIKLANFFLLRDGNVTDKEMQAIEGFEKQLERRSY